MSPLSVFFKVFSKFLQNRSLRYELFQPQTSDASIILPQNNHLSKPLQYCCTGIIFLTHELWGHVQILAERELWGQRNSWRPVPCWLSAKEACSFQTRALLALASVPCAYLSEKPLLQESGEYFSTDSRWMLLLASPRCLQYRRLW